MTSSGRSSWPRGAFTKQRQLDTARLRLTDDRDWQPGIRWVGFDPDTYPDCTPIQARVFAASTGTMLASTEVLSAALLYPRWIDSWGAERPAPNLSGLEVEHDGAWAQVPCIDRWHSDGSLILEAGHADTALEGWASPIVRDVLAQHHS